ncbi:S-adenosylmethionine decarboxylase [Ilumatobacter sp.]|uniref:S-adenosylmethionine decarboxylase n=1 Tax=Ilumatobacter sp. TaxID=1967498 RepID=UPI003B52F7D8
MTSVNEPFGWSLSIDVYGCDVDRLESSVVIRTFATELCDEVLVMKRYGDPLIEWFGTADPKTAGYTLVQLIETSSVVAHFSGGRRSAHLDVFSCAPYDVVTVERFCREYFGGACSTAAAVTRR